MQSSKWEKKSVWEEDENDLKKSALYIHTFFFPVTLGVLVSFFSVVMWIPLYSSVCFVVLCAGMSYAKFSFFFPPPVSEVEGLKGTVAVSGNWKSCLLIPPQHWNTKSGITYSCTHMQPHNMVMHKEGCKQVHTHTQNKKDLNQRRHIQVGLIQTKGLSAQTCMHK